MTVELIRNKMKKIEDAKEKLLLQEKLLREKEKKKRYKNFTEIGKLAFKADIDVVEKKILLGAFLEISQRIKNKNDILAWTSQAEQFLQKYESKNQSPISITFAHEIDVETKKILKEYDFRWNRIRKEYLGYGFKSELENLLAGKNAKINEI